MANEGQFSVLEISALVWPDSVRLPQERFRLFVAADTTQTTTEQIADFTQAALKMGMVYCCAWGPGCERFHDIVDEVSTARELDGLQPPTPEDTIMTTWHKHESLVEALDFFGKWAMPTAGYSADSNYRLVVCVGHPEWASTAVKCLKANRLMQ